MSGNRFLRFSYVTKNAAAVVSLRHTRPTSGSAAQTHTAYSPVHALEPTASDEPILRLHPGLDCV